MTNVGIALALIMFGWLLFGVSAIVWHLGRIADALGRIGEGPGGSRRDRATPRERLRRMTCPDCGGDLVPDGGCYSCGLDWEDIVAAAEILARVEEEERG